MLSTGRFEGMSLAERYRIATGLEPPTISEEDKARYAREREEAWQQAREIYGDDSAGQADVA